jgi:hypothetical protein
MEEFPKKYDHSFEPTLYKEWEEAGYFKPEVVNKLT